MSKYAKAFAEAMQNSRISSASVVAEIGGTITVGNVSHWKHGRRPVPAAHAPALARLLKVAPESISESYANLLRAQSLVGEPAAAPAGHVSLARLDSFGSVDGRSRLVLPDFLVLPRIGATDVQNIRWTLQPTTAMAPEIPRGALLLVDVSVATVDRVSDGGVFAYTLWGRPDVRRILIRRDGLAFARQSGSADQTYVGQDELEAVVVHGQVLGWIRSTNDSDIL